jgi:hypothetical protein
LKKSALKVPTGVLEVWFSLLLNIFHFWIH